jgi:hypothetical protein
MMSEATTVEPEETSIAKQHGKQHVSATMNTHTMEEWLEAVFSLRSMPRLYI